MAYPQWHRRLSGRWSAPLIAVAAAGAGLPVGLLAAAWIALDGWSVYRDRYDLGHLLGAAAVTLFVLATAGVALGLAIGRRSWLIGLLAWPVVAIGIPSLVSADSGAALLAALRGWTPSLPRKHKLRSGFELLG